MTRTSLFLVPVLLAATSACFSQETLPPPPERVPVLVELFTSEGCFSCPPADRFVEYLDSQPFPGINLVVLSEHVDYWNHLGWRDPYSSREFTDRQRLYSNKFHLPDVYTPQLVVDGSREMVGSSAKEAEIALQEARAHNKFPIEMKVLTADGSRLQLHLEIPPFVITDGPQKVEVYIALALNHAEGQVKRGENAKKLLTHTAVVRKMTKVGTITSSEQFSRNIELKTGDTDPNGLRVVAFLQDPVTHKVYGAAMKPAVKPW